ncbi:hypothetical protein H4R33_004418 [Dimargaris cristalligena]|nr:hypothetical protein H4R33_004418 [Dimargaris cristalligena]
MLSFSLLTVSIGFLSICRSSLSSVAVQLSPSSQTFQSLFSTSAKVSSTSTSTSTSTTNPAPEAESNISSKVIYQGPLAKTAKYLKRFSMTSLTATFVLAPLIMTIDSGLAPEIRTVLASSAIATSGVSTALIHWAMHPYITKLTAISSDTDQTVASPTTTTARMTITPETTLRMESLDFFGRTKLQAVRVKDLARSQRVFTVWKVARHSVPPPASLSPTEPPVSYAPVGTVFFAHEEAAQTPELTSVFNLVSGKEASLQGRAQALQKSQM